MVRWKRRDTQINWWWVVVTIVGVAMSSFQLYTGIFGSLEAFYQRTIHLAFALVLAFLLYRNNGKREQGVQPLDAIYLILAIIASGYLIINHDYLVSERLYYVTPLTMVQYVLGLVGIGVILEATRRVVGPQLPIVALAFIIYTFIGPWLPGFLKHSGFPLGLLLDVEYLTTAGIFSSPIAISSTYLFLFVLLGAVLAETGFGEFLINFATAIAGRSRGGPAKIAVVSSGLVGSISGSAVANVVTTGTFTIPLMKRVGYQPHFAGAVEAAASSGGQIMPPVMGVAAFLMAQFTGIPYIQIIRYGLLPGILYFAAVYFMVDLEAARLGLRGLSKEELPNLWKTLKDAWLAAPMVLLVLVLIRGYSPNLAATVGILSALAVAVLNKKNRLTLPKLVAALRSGAEQALPVVLSCATAGIIVGVVGLTGLGANFTRVLVDLSGGNLLLGLIYTMVAGIILGMGLPTGAMYVIQVALIIPSLIQMGLPVYVAHMFVVYFAAVSMITPPVCLASYAAAGIAGADAMKVGWTGMRIGAAAYIVPFMFAFSPALLLVGTPVEVIEAAITAVVGTYALAIALEGFFISSTNFLQRAMALAAALLLIKPGLTTDVIGAILLSLVYLWQRRSVNKQRAIRA